MTRRYLIALIILLALAGCSAGRGCRQEPPPVTPTVPPPPTIAATMTPKPSKTPVATFTPIAPIETPQTPTNTPTAVFPYDTPTPTAYVEPPTATPATPMATEPVKGVHTVVRGDSLWGIACAWYADMPLLPGANPLTPCTCWPGIYWRNGALHAPQLIYPNERTVIPLQCGQGEFAESDGGRAGGGDGGD